MILVVGATGDLGGLIVGRLLDRGDPVRILVRPGSEYAGLVHAGAQPVMGDLKDAASLAAACRGVTAVVTTATATARGGDDTIASVDHAGNANLIEAATAAGVGRFVFVSSLGADATHPMPLLQAKGEAEQRLHASGMTWTVLQPNLYMDKLPMMAVGGPAFAGQPVTLIGDGRRVHSIVALRDVATYAVMALDHPDAYQRTLVIGGPQPVSWRDIVAAFSEELGRELFVRYVPLGQPVAELPDFLVELLSALETYDSPVDSSALAAAFGVVPTTLAEFVRERVMNGLGVMPRT